MTTGFGPAADLRGAQFTEVSLAGASFHDVNLAGTTQQHLERTYAPPVGAAWPPPGQRTAIECLHVILIEEWWHHRFAVRDLAAL